MGTRSPAIGAADVEEKHHTHHGAFHPSNSCRFTFSSLPGLPVTATPVGLALVRATRDLPRRRRSPGPVTACAGTRASDTGFTRSPTYPPGHDGKPGTGYRAPGSCLASSCKGTRARVAYPSSGRCVKRAMG